MGSTGWEKVKRLGLLDCEGALSALGFLKEVSSRVSFLEDAFPFVVIGYPDLWGWNRCWNVYPRLVFGPPAEPTVFEPVPFEFVQYGPWRTTWSIDEDPFS